MRCGNGWLAGRPAWSPRGQVFVRTVGDKLHSEELAGVGPVIIAPNFFGRGERTSEVSLCHLLSHLEELVSEMWLWWCLRGSCAE
jgi:hypothetical protein